MKIAFPTHFGWIDEQGALFQPIAKSLSPLVIIVCVFIYSNSLLSPIIFIAKTDLFFSHVFCFLQGLVAVGYEFAGIDHDRLFSYKAVPMFNCYIDSKYH